ncbi:FAST kinase domain-containing protein 2, mitochondrial [Spea bombifrons]|uniref:FAST kinase domain-containing protein 2, mitochondrial n=1 Tax=Spea bombifrons TaxID=233779 RepID=UPI002348FAD5|nr:FAST kinase domain-containing protein 2, mitochondrial [Spea bombifrons]
MSDKAYLCLVRTLRHLQSCSSSVGIRIPQSAQNYTSKTSLRSLKPARQTHLFPSAYSQPAAPLRFLSTVAPGSVGEQNVAPDIADKVLVDVKGNLHEDKLDSNSLNFVEEGTEDQSSPSRTKEVNIPHYSEVFRQCYSPSDVLDLCSGSSLSLKHVSNSFTTMWTTFKKIKQGQGQRHYEKQLMFEHPNFENLCRQAMHTAHKMTLDDLVYTLHAVVKLQVPQNSRLVQTLLRVCQEHLNEFEEREMSILASSLNVMESCRNVDSLRSGLRLLVEVRMPEINGILPLQTMMRCIGKDAPLSLKKKLERKALEMLDQFTLPNAQHMFTTLAAVNMRSFPLLNFCKQKIIENVDGIPFWRLIHILNACHQLSYRDEEMLTAIGDYVVDTMYMWQNKQVSLFLLQMETLGFRHVSLLDSFAKKVMESPQELTLKDLIAIIKVYSALNHLPEERSQEFLKALDTSLQLYLVRISPVELLKVVYYFCMLGFLPPSPLETLLKDEVLNELQNSAIGKQKVERNLQMLHSIKLCLQLDENASFPEAMCQIRPPDVTSTAQPEVETTLHAILGDPALVQKKIHLPSNYYVDFMFAFDTEHNKVIPLPETHPSDDPQHTERVAVLCIQSSQFAAGTLHPLGMLAMKMRHLKTLGYRLILVPLHKFRQLKEAERVMFLRSQIFPGESSAAEELENQNAHTTHQS